MSVSRTLSHGTKRPSQFGKLRAKPRTDIRPEFVLRPHVSGFCRAVSSLIAPHRASEPPRQPGTFVNVVFATRARAHSLHAARWTRVSQANSCSGSIDPVGPGGRRPDGARTNR